MAIIKTKTLVKGFFFQLEVRLEGKKLTLVRSLDGDKWESTDLIEVKDGKLSILFHGDGIAGGGWEFSLTDLETQKEIYKNEGTNVENGHSLFTDFVEIKDAGVKDKDKKEVKGNE